MNSPVAPPVQLSDHWRYPSLHSVDNRSPLPMLCHKHCPLTTLGRSPTTTPMLHHCSCHAHLEADVRLLKLKGSEPPMTIPTSSQPLTLNLTNVAAPHDPTHQFDAHCNAYSLLLSPPSLSLLLRLPFALISLLADWRTVCELNRHM